VSLVPKVPLVTQAPQVQLDLRALLVRALTTRVLSPQPRIFLNPPLKLLPTLFKTRRHSTSIALAEFGKTLAPFKVHRVLMGFKEFKVSKVCKVSLVLRVQQVLKEFRVSPEQTELLGR
jgi:hypothetical protein